MDRIKECITECKETHVPCATSSTKWRPTRLIRISSSGREISIDSAAVPVRYVALSYCWGTPNNGRPSYITTSENLKQRCDPSSFHLTDIPQTLQDAIRLTIAIGFSYIWIDCLCIIQDCRDDWAKEAAVMDRVYSNADITIVAQEAASVHDGFLKPHCTTAIAPSLPYHVTAEDGQRFSGTLRLARIVGKLTDRRDTGPWGCRGWTLQEELLSTRILYCYSRAYRYASKTHNCLEGITGRKTY
jgi:hypothetical protein